MARGEKTRCSRDGSRMRSQSLEHLLALCGSDQNQLSLPLPALGLPFPSSLEGRAALMGRAVAWAKCGEAMGPADPDHRSG